MSRRVRSPGQRYLALALGAVALAVAGYAGYVLYPRFDLPAGTGVGLLVLAAAAGVASFFSPCSFPLLVSMLARPLQADRESAQRPPLRRAAGFAAALSLGASAFLLLAGLVIALGGGRAFEDITFTSTTGRIIRSAVGAFLIALGLVQLERLHVNLRRLEPATHRFLRGQARLRRRHPFGGFVLFGFGYLLAGFG